MAGRQVGREVSEGEREKRDGASFRFMACEYWLVSQVGKVPRDVVCIPWGIMLLVAT